MAAPTFAQLSPALIDESKLNPRREFDAAKLAELAASVAERGVLEPLLVRPVGERYEVIAGARRLRASKAAGLKSVPCMVREASDAELLELALLENVVRADINALEEGEAYAALVKQHGYTADSIAEKTGKSRTVVYSRMKLAQLQGRARDLVLKEGLNASIGELLSRLPTLAAQEEAVTRLEEEFGYDLRDGYDTKAPLDWSRLSYRDAKQLLDDELKLEVKDAPFDTKDTTLFSVAGACTTCPKRTSQDKALFPDVKADTCLDSACWATKKSTALARLQADLKDKGKKLVKGGEKLFTGPSGDQLTYAAREKYARPTDEVADKKLKDVLDKAQLESVSVVAVGPDGTPHTLVDKAAAAELLAKKAPAVAKELKPRPASKPYDYAAENKKREQQYAAEEAAQTALLQLASKKLKGDVFAVLDVLVDSLNDYDMKHFSKLAGIPAGAKKLTEDQRLMVLLASALDRGGGELLAKKLKVDLKKMEADELAKLKAAEKQAEAEKEAAETTAKLKAADKAQAKKAGKKAGKKAA